MKLRLLLTLFSFLLLALPVLTLAQTQTGITENQLMALVNSVDRASRKGNVAGLIAPLARDVKIKMTFTNPAGNQEKVLALTKEQYAFHTRNGMRRRLAYQLVRKNTRLKIYDAATAMITSEIYETMTIKEGTLRGVTSEVAMVTLRDGKLVVTSIDSRTRFY